MNSSGKISLGYNKVISVWYKMSLWNLIKSRYLIGKWKYRTSNLERNTSQRLWFGNHPCWVIITAMILNEITLFLHLILPPLIISFLGDHLHLEFQRRQSIHRKFIELVGNKTKENKKSKQEFYKSQETRGIQAGSDPLYQMLYKTWRK